MQKILEKFGYLTESMNDAVRNNDIDEIGRVSRLISEEYEKLSEVSKRPYECGSFAEAIRVIDESLETLYVNNKKVIKEFATLVKGDKNLESQYRLLRMVESYALDGMAEEYLDECLKQVSVDAGKLNESNEKLYGFVRKHNLRPQSQISEDDKNVFASLENVISGSKHNLNNYISGKKTIVEYMEDNKKPLVENKVDIAVMVGDYKEKNEIRLNEDEKRIVSIITGNDKDLQRSLFEDIKGECNKIVCEMMKKCSDDDERDGVKDMKLKIEGKTFENDGVNGIIKLIEIMEVLS